MLLLHDVDDGVNGCMGRASKNVAPPPTSTFSRCATMLSSNALCRRWHLSWCVLNSCRHDHCASICSRCHQCCLFAALCRVTMPHCTSQASAQAVESSDLHVQNAGAAAAFTTVADSPAANFYLISTKRENTHPKLPIRNKCSARTPREVTWDNKHE